MNQFAYQLALRNNMASGRKFQSSVEMPTLIRTVLMSFGASGKRLMEIQWWE